MKATAPTITLKEALEKMESGQPFNLVFYTADKKRKTAGKRKEVKNVTIAASDYKNSIRTIKRPNVEALLDVHIRLMTHFNRRRIIY